MLFDMLGARWIQKYEHMGFFVALYKCSSLLGVQCAGCICCVGHGEGYMGGRCLSN